MKRSRDRLRLVAEAARTFAEVTTDYERLLDGVARRVSDVIGDACSVFLLSDDGASLNAVALHATDPEALAQLREMFGGRAVLLVDEPSLREIVDTGAALLVPRVELRGPRSDTTASQVDWQRKLGLHSYLVVALRAHGRTLGVLSLGRFRADAPPFDEEDREMAQSLADHAALAIDNARLYVVAQSARRRAERTEETLRRSEKTHRFFFEASPTATFLFDVDSLRILAGNPAALKLYGYTASEFMELHLPALRLPDAEAELRRTMHALRDRDMAGAALHRRKDGAVIQVEGRSHLTSFEGRPARIVVVEDHTERLRAAGVLLELEGRLRRTLDSMLEGYTILGPDLRYLYVNDVGARQARLTKEELIGHTPMELYPDFEKSGMYGLLQRCLKDRAPIHEEEELTLADGSKVYFEVNIQATSEGVVVLSIDTTERRRAARAQESLEEQLRQSQKMDAVGRLAGGVAHDFNNLLTVILGYGDALVTDLAPGSPMRKDLEAMTQAARSAAALTNQLLMVSRQQVLEAKVLDLNGVLGEMESMLRRVAPEPFDLVTVLDPTVGHIRVDRGNLEQVVMNLVVNARDAMPDGGRLTIETANVFLDEAFVQMHLGTAPGPYVLLAVSDTGVGMDKATRERIFEPFFTTKALGRGTGLGLSTVFGIVRQSGGGVWVYTEPGRGTTFKIYLPRVEGPVDGPVLEVGSTNLRGSETVLLVEDEEAVRGVAERLLTRNGYRVIVARDVADACALRQRDLPQIHLLLTDVVMPHMTGPELAAQLAFRWPEMKVLYMSGYTDASVTSQGALAGGVHFLQKPFTVDSLARKVRSVLDARDVGA